MRIRYNSYMLDNIKEVVTDVIDTFKDSQVNLNSDAARNILTNSVSHAVYNTLRQDQTSKNSICPFTSVKVGNECYVSVRFGDDSSKPGMNFEIGPIAEHIGSDVVDRLEELLNDNLNASRENKVLINE